MGVASNPFIRWWIFVSLVKKLKFHSMWINVILYKNWKTSRDKIKEKIISMRYKIKCTMINFIDNI